MIFLGLATIIPENRQNVYPDNIQKGFKNLKILTKNIKIFSTNFDNASKNPINS